jgi:hypothetical protein
VPLTFDFCPNSMVPKTVPPEPARGMGLNGWEFTSKPAVPYRRKFKITLGGLRWYLQSNGLYDTTTNPTVNASRLEAFYKTHQNWLSFNYPHPHIGTIVCLFDGIVEVPAGIPNSGGLVELLEIGLIEYNPGF